MTDIEKLVADLKNHRQAYIEGVMKAEHREITAKRTVNELGRAIGWIKKGYLNEKTDRAK